MKTGLVLPRHARAVSLGLLVAAAVIAGLADSASHPSLSTSQRPSPPAVQQPHSGTPAAAPPQTGRPSDPHGLARTAGRAKPATPPITDNKVYVVGDSVLLGTVDTLPAAMHGWRVTMNCVESRRLPEAIPIIRANRSKMGSVVVIQMGNNYIAGEDGTFASQINTTMRILRRVPLVVWVTVAEKWTSRIGINNAIRAAAHRFANVRVADWAPIMAAHPSYAYDGLHLTPSGRLAMARLIAHVVGPPPHAGKG